MISEVFNMDCMEGMKQYPDKYFELAIVDPPYGIGQNYNFRKTNLYKNIEQISQEYVNELFRISKQTIIWGANYFTNLLPISRGWICWDKVQTQGNYFSDFELAWTNFDITAKLVKCANAGFNHSDLRNGENSTIHPTQKPIALYKWLLKNYAKEGAKILDTHLGSGSSRIAAYDMGFDFTGYELDKDYFDASVKRFEQFRAQQKLFI